MSLGDNTTVYSFAEDKILHSKEYVMSLGYRRMPDFRQISSTAVKKLAGQAICLPCLATVLLPCVLLCDLEGVWENSP